MTGLPGSLTFAEVAEKFAPVAAGAAAGFGVDVVVVAGFAVEGAAGFAVDGACCACSDRAKNPNATIPPVQPIRPIQPIPPLQPVID